MNLFSKFPVVLGSSSPRRRELLSSLGVDFKIIKPGYEEAHTPGEAPDDYVIRNALEKGRWILNHSKVASKSVIISADTIVVLGDKIIEKPKDQEDAAYHLRNLSGNTHQVLTGDAIHQEGCAQAIRSEIVKSHVTFKTLSDTEITQYIETGEPMDKSGCYAVQGRGSFMIERLEGSVTNVIGLPLAELIGWLYQL